VKFVSLEKLNKRVVLSSQDGQHGGSTPPISTTKWNLNWFHFYLLTSRIFIYMRLIPILIQEGRKENLRKKYTEKFKEYPETLDFILGISDLADTNFKYADFILRELHPNSDTDEVEKVVELVKDFDRFQQALEYKDINDYDIDGLESIINRHKITSKSQLKKIDSSGTEKLYEDDNILIVRPLTYEASCKYGAGTKWCTAMASEPSYFKSHTREAQALYYIILKKFNKDNKFYKMAVHLTPNTETWYDSTDTVMSDREKDVFELGAPKTIKTIREHFKKFIDERKFSFLNKVFNKKFYDFLDVSKMFGKIDYKVGLEFLRPELMGDMSGHATMQLNISVNGENINQYLVMMIYEVEELLEINIGFEDINFEDDSDFVFDIEKLNINLMFSLNSIKDDDDNRVENFFNNLCYEISQYIIPVLKKNREFVNFLNGGKKTWQPNRSSYGFTFKQNKGLVKKLVDYLDSGKKGTKLDFLVDIGSLIKKEINGNPYYSNPTNINWQIPSTYRGQLSGFFNSAKLAGILDYDKEGRSFILKKGPNFETFKSGELKAI
jgi:hypothetical protein